MYNQKKTALLRITVLILIVLLTVPTASATTIHPRASLYLSNYGASVYLPGNGEVRVYFDVEGTRYMDEVGALTIELYESTDRNNWTCVKIFNHSAYPNMLSYNDDYHSGYVSYNGVSGRYYKAYVGVWAGNDGAGDSRYFWTSVKN